MYSLVIMDDMEEAAQEAQRAVEASPLGSLFSIIRVANSAELKILRGGGRTLRCADRRHSAGR